MSKEYCCQNCGEKIVGFGFRFCPFCGTKIKMQNEYLQQFCSELLKGKDPRNTHLFFDENYEFSPEEEQVINIVLGREKKDERHKKIAHFERRGERWSKAEEEQLKQEYLSKLPIYDICKAHKRSKSAVQLRILNLFPEITLKNKTINEGTTEKEVKVGSKIKYINLMTGKTSEIKIVPPKFTEKPFSGTGAYYDLDTRIEVIPPDIGNHEITSVSEFAQQVFGKTEGSVITIYPEGGNPYSIEILEIVD